MPGCQELLDILGARNEFFGTIDLRLGYYHIPLTADAKRKTAFSTPQGQFQFRVMSFGMKRSPKVFQRAVTSILHGLVGRTCLVYIDDIIVFGADFHEYLHRLDEVLMRLATAGASISLTKSQFLATEVRYLGFLVDKDSTRPAPDTLEAVQQYPVPTTVKQLQSFLGLASYVRQYVPHFAKYESILRQAVKGTPSRLHWSNDAQKAFDAVKAILVKDVRLRRFDPSLYTEVHTDASSHAVGAVLLQGTDKDHLHVVQYASQTLAPCQTRYSTTEREMYAVKWAVVHKFRHYLEGRHFIVRTDHQPLVHELKLKNPSSTRLVQLSLKLAPFDFEIHHIKGKDNAVADSLSRLPAPKAPPKAKQPKQIRTAAQPPPHVAVLLQTREVQDPDQRIRLIHQLHKEYGHAGWQTVLQGLRARFFWPKMRQQVWETLLHCPQCIKFNPPSTAVGSAPKPLQTQRPLQRVCIDVVPMPHAQGNSYMLLAIDHFTKYAVARPVPNATANQVIRFLQQYHSTCGPFEQLLSDPGTQFTSTEFQEYVQQTGFTHDSSGIRHFKGNGCVERLVRTIQNILAKMGATSDTWPRHLPAALLAYNSRPHSTTKTEPAAAFFQTPVQLPVDKQYGTSGPTPPTTKVMLQQTQRSTAAWTDPRHRPRDFARDSMVLHVPRPPTTMRHSRDRRFRPLRSGPYRVLQPLARNRYLVEDADGFQQTIPGWELQHAPEGPRDNASSFDSTVVAQATPGE